MNNELPLSLIMENTRRKMVGTFNDLIVESQLPAYLIEGMLLEVLAEVRSRKNAELLADISRIQQDRHAENSDAKTDA